RRERDLPARRVNPRAAEIVPAAAADGPALDVVEKDTRQRRVNRIHQSADPVARVLEHRAVVHADPGIDYRVPPGPILLWEQLQPLGVLRLAQDRKSTRLNSSHQIISYAVFCLKKKTTQP